MKYFQCSKDQCIVSDCGCVYPSKAGGHTKLLKENWTKKSWIKEQIVAWINELMHECMTDWFMNYINWLHKGTRCELNVDECSSNPCQNGGRCVDGLGGYHCLCFRGFTGSDCVNNIDECASDPCVHGRYVNPNDIHSGQNSLVITGSPQVMTPLGFK